MDQKLKEILSQVYEIEGLLLVVDNHKQETNPFVFDLIKKKGEAIMELTKGLSPDIFNKVKEHTETLSSIGNVEQEEKDETPEIKAPNFDGVEMLGADSNSDEDYEDTEFETSDDTDVDELTDNQSEDTDSILSDGDDEIVDLEYDENHDEELISDNEDETEIVTDDVAEEDSENDDELFTDSDDEIEEVADDDLSDEELSDDNSDDEVIFEGDEDTDDDIDNADDVTRLDDALRSTISKNLKKAFTLNDRFRFKRELFGNSDVEMTTTLNLIETMSSYQEAEEYCYNDLEWDAESPEVQEFMEIIKKHFT